MNDNGIQVVSFDPNAFGARNQFFRGRWDRVRAWEDINHLNRWRRGVVTRPIWEHKFPNGITDVGMHYALEASFRSGSQEGSWYAGLIDDAGYTGVNAGDTASDHSGWVENQDYNESVRQTLAFGAAASRKITDEVSFTMNDNVTIRGLFVITVNTKGATTGTLFSTALFTTPAGLSSGNVLTANYSLSD